MLNTLSNLLLTDVFITAVVRLLLLSFLLWLVTYLIIGHKRRSRAETLHPLFGSYTKMIPNFLSYVRFPLGLWIFCVFYFERFNTHGWFFTFHVAFWLTCFFDFLDGKFARRWQAITEDGKSLDPAADKWVTFCMAITAYKYGELKDWALVIVFAREIISIFQRIRLKRLGIDVSARWLGKLKTVVQFTVLYILLLRSDKLTNTIAIEHLAKMFSSGFMLWCQLLLTFCTVISLFPFFKSFSYINNYKKTQREECMRSWYIVAIPNILTIGNYLCGITALFFSMPEIQVAHRHFVILFWILAASVCDALDGPLARKLKSFSEFGACIDSSTDLSTFGLATAAIIFLRFSAIKGGNSFLGLFLGLFYFLFVHLRLARFTVLAEQNDDKSKKQDFIGLPSPAGSAGVLILFTFFENVIPLSISTIIISLLMYSNMNLISHSNSLKVPIYKYFLIPTLLAGFIMLLILIFQQPFISMHFSKELIVYFRICSWILFIPLVIYLLDGIRRTYFKPKAS